MRKTLKAFGILTALLFVCVITFAFVDPIVVTVRNDSDQTLAAISIRAQDRLLSFPDLPSGHSASRWFHNTGADDHYSLSAVLQDGTSVKAEEGYITSGSFYGTAQFNVMSSGLVAFTESC